ncbi:hypothetical protein [Nannocystis sp. SCPEA4]|uniref:hypothetical protein n=1 Tax=Nannocystis sp. SCPEA4 TaxID=2996787 RepID=UPI002270554D|nr:hypothetical protein [Nannocystis sp. SCPEA4]MCY1059455.1 hypothetical protein [Nannocystis sp. SCPEA4]
MRRAKEAKSDEQRALYFNVAHRSYLALFDRTGDPRHLCAARRMYDKSMAIKNQPAEQRANFNKLLGELTAREREADVRCERAASKPTKSDPPLLVAKGSSPAEAAEAPRKDDPADELHTRAAAPGAPREDANDPAPPEETRAIESSKTVASSATQTVKAEGPAPLPAAQHDAAARRPPARIIAGASLLVAGAGLAGGMVGSLIVRRNANAAILALDQQATAEVRELTATEHAAIEAGDLKYRNYTIAAWVTGAAAIVSAVTGVALLAAPPRAVRHARLRVGPGELVFSF